HLGLDLVDYVLCVVQLRYSADERQNNSEPPMHVGPHDGAQLDAKHLLHLEGEPYGAQAQGRVLLSLKSLERQLVSAQVEYADVGPGIAGRFGQLAIFRVLFFLAGKIGQASQEQEFRTIQPDSLSTK